MRIRLTAPLSAFAVTSFALRFTAFLVASCLALQGFAIAMERMSRAGHFHVDHAQDHDHDHADGDHGHDHDGGHHHHSAIEHHSHDADEEGVVCVEDESSDADQTNLLKRICLDQESLVESFATQRAVQRAALNCARASCALRSHVADLPERPPRSSPL